MSERRYPIKRPRDPWVDVEVLQKHLDDIDARLSAQADATKLLAESFNLVATELHALLDRLEGKPPRTIEDMIQMACDAGTVPQSTADRALGMRAHAEEGES